MQNNLDLADKYFLYHRESDAWNKLSQDEKESLLNSAALYIKNSFDLRNGTDKKDVYFHAIYEQAIFLLVRDKERALLQNDGVTSYKIDDISFTMNQTIISPVSHTFLQKYIYKKLGEIV